MRKLYTLILIFYGFGLYGQEYFPKNDGVKTDNQNYIAFTNATLHLSPGEVVNNGTLLIQKGRVINSGRNIKIPEGAIQKDLQGKHIYPSFIEIFSSFGISDKKSSQKKSEESFYDTKREGYYWNEHISPEISSFDHFEFDDEKAKELRNAGFGLINTHHSQGIIRGTGILVSLQSSKSDHERIISSASSQFLSFEKNQYSKQMYPNSLMGSIALLKQTYLDADWYAKSGQKNVDLSLKALNQNKNLSQIFYAGNKSNALRAHQIGKEFNVDYVLFGGIDEYELIEDIKETGATFILPLTFPKPYDLSSPFEAQYISLGDMRNWNQAPGNPAIMAKNGLRFAFSTYGLDATDDFKKELLKAIEYGLDKETALAALTTIPAQILQKSDDIGHLKQGAFANFLISSGDIFEKETILFENWVQGEAFVIHALDQQNIDGNYSFQLDDENYDLTIKNSVSTAKITLKKGDSIVKSKSSYDDKWLSISLEVDKENKKFSRLRALVTSPETIAGSAIDSEGNESEWIVKPQAASKEKKPSENTKQTYRSPVTFPNNGYGFTKRPTQKTMLFRNVTLWTNESQGIIENTDVLVKDGKISKIGNQLKAGNAEVIDGTGKHLTSGIIDEHSHIATISTNESGQNSTAEVSIEDGLNFEDINIYRNLAGGVTQAQILHGSANPIGGRSAIIKLKWGESSQGLIDQNAPKFIKFALGENVKQSNWGNNSRFPQTRMGVEQLYIDYFQRALEYDQLKSSGQTYRKDIEMEVLAEILNKERFISCHSYVQSEINMLMKVAEQFDFNINTFTHILEGYKVADKMKAHGVGGSTFSDWWAYKYEVNDAIPYNAAIMHSQGVVTAINSDDAEMSRRLNQEAAKSLKYGGVSEEEAWKFVTLNPAKLLHIDDRVGSVKVGKDADLVLWSGHPLSISSKAEKTMIEGRIYFDLQTDLLLRESIKKEKNMLINLMILAKSDGVETQKPSKKESRINHCDTVDF
ncbi:amidohydrolase family protein [Lutimonas sp.]|uniref:amidohydrolase family protein n=1 Tax=Lutimonas sp. TaxID=1872403 RepID=UPI003D9B5B56